MVSEQAIAAERKWFDLSLAQQAVWLDAKLTGSAVYQLGCWARVAMPLDQAAIGQAVSLIMARHDGLRLRVDDELPRQWLDESAEPPLSMADLPGDADPDEAFQVLAEEFFAVTMPLGDHPLFHLQVLRGGENLTYLLWRFHHLIADFASVSITLSHWFNAYEALTSGAPHDLAAPSSYLSTIASDAGYLESAAYQQDLAYWSNRFEPLPPPLISDMQMRVSGERKIPAVKWRVDGAVLSKLQVGAQLAGTSVQRALFALFAVTIGRRYGQYDLVTGVALHRRSLTNRETLGMLAGVIAVRCNFEPFWSLTEAVQAFSEQMDADLRHQRLPVDILSRALGLSGTGRAGLFEAAMSYIPSSRGEGEALIEGLPIVIGEVDAKEASPISLHIHERPMGAGLAITVTVNPSFLEAEEAQTLATLFQSAIDQFVTEPQTLLEDLQQVSSAENRSVVDEWNATKARFEAGTLDGLFSAQARRTPQAVAIVGLDGRQITYSELDELSTRLARALVMKGIRPEQVVGVRMVRSAETIIAFLAILKAGGVYLPLDPAYPSERLDYMAADAGAALVLDSIYNFDGDAELPRLDDPNRLAYIIYTSGTTGLPKGVAVPHSAPVNMAFARRACHDPLGPGDRVLAAISIGFDVSVGQLLLPLLSGATVVIAGDLKTMGAAEFWDFLADNRVSHINSVPSFFDSILDSVPLAGTLALKRLMLGGEALSGAVVARIQRKLAGVEIVNMYGPTEACIDATYHVATSADLVAAVLPIGRPLANYQTYVLDERLQPVGVGVTGELYLGGAGLARGYVNAPDLTADRFVADPFGETPGLRLYRTGDRARWRSDGELEFLGRVDQQVKIRGFRVEPAEIATALLGHAAVEQAVVVPQHGKIGGLVRLVAYVVPHSGHAIPEPADLRNFLADRLPEYMVPFAFVSISAIPLNRNGKLDEKALPSPDLLDGEYVAPRTPTEETLASLFAEILGLERCGATDHFFELGGHSLLATTLVSRMRGLGIAVSLRAIFETPTIEALATRIDNSLPTARTGAAIAPQPRPVDIPLSFSQERIWFLDRLQGDSSYNIPIALELRGKLDTAAVQQALEQIVARHEMLRTRIVIRNGTPCQEIIRAAPLSISRKDLHALNEVDKEAALWQYLKSFVRHRFDLAADPPLQFQIIALEAERHVLAAVIHHAAFDGWSAGVFLKEFGVLFSAGVQGQPAELPVLTFQYADFAVWQRRQNWDADLAYWLEELKGAPAQLDLPIRNSNVLDTTRLSGAVDFQFDRTLYIALLRLAHESGASLFMVLHAAFVVLLSQWTAADDVVIGTVTANRNQTEFEPMIGCFVNTLALRTKLSAGESFSQLLGRVKHADLAAYAHADIPFEKLVEALHPVRSLQNSPIFQVMLVLQNAPMPTAQLPGLTIHPITLQADAAKFDLTLSLTEQDGELTGTFEFAANRVESETIDRLTKQFCRVLETVSSQPSQDLSRINLLDFGERNLIVEEWNRTQTDFAKGTLHDLFSAQAWRTPDALAVVGKDGAELTYTELDARATSLARKLVANGINSERVVGVRMERSLETIIALLGILKAGGVYLPLDPSYPPDRLDYMATDAAAALVLDSIDGLAGDAELPRNVDPDRLAYIIYTSGTTGRPKGVAVSHAAPVNMAYARRACHDPLGPGDRVLAAISVGFDVSIGQLVLPLLSGAAVVIAGDLKTMGAGQFWNLLTRQRVTHVNSVPSFFDSILDAAPSARELSLKRLMLGGEPLSGALVARIQRALPAVEVVNMYGPTEACIDATYHVATKADLSAAVLPIGRPLSNYQCYVLDSRLDPAGIGIPGELYIGGTGLARVYVNAAELTAERFVANPFSIVPGERMYRTGDRVRWSEGGRIEFLGRIDQQIKIRGFRVEPEEIEAQLRKQPGIRDAAVIAQPSSGGPRLIAYCVGNPVPPLETLRASLARVLPDYMIPSAFVELEKLPLSPNGKLDRKSLPDPGPNAFLSRAFDAPVGPIEEKLARLWAEALKHDRIGRHDNFFELGGHSLGAVALVERMRQEGLDLDVRALFATPTIAGLALVAGSTPTQTQAPANGILEGCDRITPEMLPLVELTTQQLDRIVASVPGGAANLQDIYPLAPLQEGILFQHLMAPQRDPYLTPVVTAFDGRNRLDNFLRALDRVVQRHDVLRTGMAWQGLDQPVQFVVRQVAVPIEELALRTSAEQLLARFRSGAYALDLSRAPLLRAIVAQDSASDRWLLLLLTHHLILDHTSLEILVNELRVLMADPHAALPAPLPYRNFIAQTRVAMKEAHEAFFTRLLGDVSEPTAPFGLLDVQSGSSESSESRLSLDAGLAQRIREQARSLGVTPASIFHLAWASVLAAATGKADVVFGTILFGRMRSGAGADRVVGMFINTLPVRIALDHRGAQESVVSTHQLLAELMTHEHAPLPLAQRCSQVQAPAPLFSSLFNYRYSPGSETLAEWPGVEMLDAAERTNYPLSIAVDDSGASFMLTALAHTAAVSGRACRYLQRALTSLSELLQHSPAAPIQTLQALPREERNLVLEEWNRSETSFETGTLHGLFSAQAARTPDAVAVVGKDGEELTYAELAALSSRLGRQLAANSVRLGDVVGVRMPRSTETIIALLAILKAGGVYLPLDPAYPPDRLAYMASDATAALVLDSINGLTGEVDLPETSSSNHLAYIIYTSGTSGVPKGVAVSHAAPVNMAFARRACHDPLGPGDRVLAGISVGFDVSIGQLLLPLLSGATVVVAGELKTMGSAEFWALLVRQGVTHINSVPSFFDSILDAVPPRSELRLKRLMLGGEALSGVLVARIQRALPGVEVVNMYGPTEACIDATFHISTAEDLSAAVLPIGRPLSNYQTYVLDSRLEPCGVGVNGELYLGGAGLARGYLNAPDLTAERFIADPFSFKPGARLYRTGDRARWRTDGELDFLGRVDEQIKIRGFRVEPAEIEAHLRRQVGVRDAAIVALPAASGTRLMAYYTGDESIKNEDLRAGMAAVLPDYMVPGAFVKLDRLPLSANGKLDRKALSRDLVQPVERLYEAPEGTVETALQKIFQRVLGVHPVGRQDNFFELGGDSLAAMRLANSLDSHLQVTLPMRTLFEHPTIASLAEAIHNSKEEPRLPIRQEHGQLVPLQTGGAKPKLFCIHPAGGHVYCYLPLARELGIDQPIFGLQASGLEEAEPLATSIEQMASDYIRAIKRVQPAGPYHLLGMSSGGLIAYEMARQIRAGGSEVGLLGLLDTSLPGSIAAEQISEASSVRAVALELGLDDLLRTAPATVALEELVELGRTANRLPADFKLIFAERIAAVYHNTVLLYSTHKLSAWDGPMLLLRALRTGPGHVLPDWAPYVTGDLEVVDLDCGHADLVSPALAPTVAALVTARLSQQI